MEMIKQIHLCLWISMTFYSFAVSTPEVPKECAVGTPDYNEKLCSETCTLQETHTFQPYCANFTQSKPQQEVPKAVTRPEVDLVDLTSQEAIPNVDVTAPELDVQDFPSSGNSLRFSFLFSVLCLIIFWFKF